MLDSCLKYFYTSVKLDNLIQIFFIFDYLVTLLHLRCSEIERTWHVSVNVLINVMTYSSRDKSVNFWTKWRLWFSIKCWKIKALNFLANFCFTSKCIFKTNFSTIALVLFHINSRFLQNRLLSTRLFFASNFTTPQQMLIKSKVVKSKWQVTLFWKEEI